MRSTKYRIIASLVVALSGIYCAPSMAWAAGEVPSGEASYTYAFQDAQIAQIAQAILGDLGVPFTIDPSVTGRMSFRIDQRMTKAQLLDAFDAALAANNVALVRDGERLVVTAKSQAKTVAPVQTASAGSHSVGYQIVAVPLAYAVPSEVAKAVEAIAGPGTVIYASDRQGLLLLGGSGSELQSALDAVKLFDQSGLQSSRIRWFELTQAPAAMVAGELEDLLKAAGVTGVAVAPLRRLNGIILFGRTTQALDQVSQWIPRLDAPTKDTAASLWVYHPRNTTAEALAQTINSISAVQATADPTIAQQPRGPGSTPTAQAQMAVGQTPAPLGSGATAITPATSPEQTAQDGEGVVRAAVDKETNTLLISAPAWQWTKIQKILAEIDRPQGQVLIEARILEVTLSDDFRFGFDWSVIGAGGRLTVTNTKNNDGSVQAISPGFAVTYVDKTLAAAVDALGSRNDVEVVSAPKVLALDNHTARLEVGDQIPIVTQQSQATVTSGAPVINSVDYRNSGVILNVTPRISGDDRIVLDVEQEVSSALQTTTSTINSPTIQERRMQSTLVLNDGGVVALGGMISSERDSGDTGIPGLKDIPVVGSLFKSQNHSLKRTELVVLLSAKIIKDNANEQLAMTQLLADMREIRGRGLLDRPH